MSTRDGRGRRVRSKYGEWRNGSWINAAAQLSDLRFPPGNQLEALKRDRAGQHSIRINDQYRVCFIWTDAGAVDAEIADYH